jgi:tetratricopeptide (TPR) repeat protein
MKHALNFFSLIIVLYFVTGCGGVLGAFTDFTEKISKETSDKASQDPGVFSSSDYIKKATVFEKNDELQAALFYFKIAGALSPDDPDIADKISHLKSTVVQKSLEHLQKGVNFYKTKQIKEARYHFLTALRYDPDNKEALDYLQNRLLPKEYIPYRVSENDTLASISEKFYKNPEETFLIVYFNDLKPNTDPLPGTTLKLPILASKLIRPTLNIPEELLKAQSLLKKKRYKGVVRATERILQNDPTNPTAVDLRNSAYYQMGLQLSREKKYPEAINMFKNITPESENVKKSIQEIIEKELWEAENFLKEKKYTAAIDVSENILSHDQSNKTAKDVLNAALCQNGKSLLIRKKYAEAVTVLNRADPEYDCVERTLSAVENAMKKQAEIHYLQGVKYFLNEELQNAIKEWEMTLTLDPEHIKAEKDIKNARSLLEKLKKVQ